jgi:hypothetical protein
MSTAVIVPSNIFAEVTVPSANLVVIIALSAIFSVVSGGKMFGATYTMPKVVTKDKIHVTTIMGIAFLIEITPSDIFITSVFYLLFRIIYIKF